VNGVATLGKLVNGVAPFKISVGRQIRFTQIYLGTYLDFSVGTHLGWSLYLGYLPEQFSSRYLGTQIHVMWLLSVYILYFKVL
jgi:hypothetical protein